MLYKLVNALIFSRRYRNNWHPEHSFHRVYIYRSAVSRDLIHHIQRNNDGDLHFKKLHCKIQIPLNVGSVYDIDYTKRFFVKNKIPRYELFA